ncbi:11-beta-hydroxysteroid dehydrogenase-like 4A isoform X1 [Brassica napus]|uniref:11-beta-hydroxysteroid dehydrogenase-like 4A isoform X1 n=1 Tax=Brassica napus TaxID=3708 RepID=UPI00207A7C28|nr:11-beta-hydroxysteroid dehydrogenase-like 4A isoform X1 [Brassica napus]
MALINKILNIFLPIVTFSLLVVFMPISILFSLFGFIRNSKESDKVSGKVVIITGSSSGIGEVSEFLPVFSKSMIKSFGQWLKKINIYKFYNFIIVKHLAYEYARRGAYLTLVARREDRLRLVANRCRRLGSPDVAVVRGDVSVIEDCKRFIEETISRFGRLDHLVNNAGIAEAKFFEDYLQISDVLPIMNTNFWGPVYTTHFAIPHLKKTKGKIVAVASPAGWSGVPRMSIYAASKAAMINFYETLRIELGPEIGVTIVFPGLVENENTNPDLLAEKQDWSQVVAIESATECAKAVVNGICRGKTFLAEPSWVRVLFWLSILCPELLISKPKRN